MMNYVPILTHLVAILFGGAVSTVCWALIFREQDQALADADETIDALNTALAIEKAENENLVGINGNLRRRLLPFITKRPRDEKGHFISAKPSNGGDVARAVA